MFIAALFTVTRTWRQPKCPSAEEWIKKMWNLHTMEYYLVIKKKIMPFAATWMDLEVVILSEVGQRKTNIMVTSRYMWNQKNGASELIYITEIESQV